MCISGVEDKERLSQQRMLLCYSGVDLCISGVEDKERLSQQRMLLCYSGVDLCVFQVWRTRSACPSSACYCAIVGLTCVYFRCGGQGARVPAAHVTVL